MSSDEKIEENDESGTESWCKLADVPQKTTTPPNSVLDSSMEECLLDAMKEGSSTTNKSRTNSSPSSEADQAQTNVDSLMENVETADTQQELADLQWVWNWSNRPEASSPICLSTWQNKMKHYELVERSTSPFKHPSADATTPTTTTTPTTPTPTTTNNNNGNNSSSSPNPYTSPIIERCYADVSVDGCQKKITSPNKMKSKHSDVDRYRFYNTAADDEDDYTNSGSSMTFILITHACTFFIGVSLAFWYFRRYNENITCYNI